MKRLAAILPFLFAACLAAQNPSVIFVPSAPTGACTGGPPVEVVISTGTMYTCQGGTWTAVGGGGSSGFPITLGSTSIAAGSTTTSIAGLTIDGVSPTTMAFVDATSSIQTQLNGKASSTAFTTVNGQTCALGGSCQLTVPVVLDTSTPVTVSTTNASEYHFNQNATAATAVTYNLPTAAAGKQFCFSNSNNGSAANTGVLTIATSASGQFIVFTDGTLSATGGNITSGGAAADAACVVGEDATHWMLYVQRGTWTKH